MHGGSKLTPKREIAQTVRQVRRGNDDPIAGEQWRERGSRLDDRRERLGVVVSQLRRDLWLSEQIASDPELGVTRLGDQLVAAVGGDFLRRDPPSDVVQRPAAAI